MLDLPPSTSSSLPLFFFNDTATTEIYTLSLHDALPILVRHQVEKSMDHMNELWSCRTPQDFAAVQSDMVRETTIDRKSTRLNSSHTVISYAVFCLKKKKKKKTNTENVHQIL